MASADFTSTAPGAPPALGSAPVTGPSRVRALIGRLSESWHHALSQSRPWKELVDRSSFGKPDSVGEATGRIRKNLAFFRLNYAVLFTVVIALTLLTNPVSLFLLCALFGAWMFAYLLRTTPLVLFNRTYSEREVLLFLGIFSVVVIFMTNVGSLLISAAMLGFGIICLHAAFRVPDDLFLDEEPASSAGLLSFLNVGTGSGAPSLSVNV